MSFLAIDSRLNGLNLNHSEKEVLTYLIGWVRTNKKKPIGGKVNMCFRTVKEMAGDLQRSESGIKKIILNLVKPKKVKVGGGEHTPVEIRQPLVSKVVGRVSYFSLENDVLLEIAGITKDEATTTKVIIDREKDAKAKRALFYATLNSAVSVQEFGAALDHLPHDIGHFMLAWSRAFLKTQGHPFVWDSRNYGILKGYWRSAAYGRARRFDYWRLERFFRNEGGDNFIRHHARDEEVEQDSEAEGLPSIQAFLHFDKGLGYRDQSTDLSACIKNPRSLFYLPEESASKTPEPTLEAKRA